MDSTREEILRAASLVDQQEGYDPVDRVVAKAILSAPVLSDRQIDSLWRMLEKYRHLLEGAGIDYSALVPPSPSRKCNGHRVDIAWTAANRISIKFDYDADLVKALKRVKKTPSYPPWYDGPSRSWVIPDDFALLDEVRKALEAAGKSLDVRVDPNLDLALKEAKIAKSRAYEASRAPDASIEVPTKVPLYPFQRAGVQWIEDRRGRAMIADEMGLGKSCQTLGFLVRHPEALPALVVCPATLKMNWCKEIRKFTDFNPLILASKSNLKAFLKLGIDAALTPQAGYDAVVMNYDLLGTESPRTWLMALKNGDDSVVEELLKAGQYAMRFLQTALAKASGQYKARLLEVVRSIELQGQRANQRRYVKVSINGTPIRDFLAFGFKTIVCDESHYIKDRKNQRTLAILELAKKIRNVLCLTGTPLLNKPAELWTQIYAVNPRVFPSFLKFAERHCAAKKTRFGTDFSGASNLDELEKTLRSEVMIRRTKEQVLRELPEKIRVTIPIVLEKGLKKYQEETQPLVEDLVRIKQERDEWRKLLDSKTEEEREKFLAEHAEESARKNRLTSTAVKEIEKIKQVAAAAKLDDAARFIIDVQAQQGKVVVFLIHHETIDRMVGALEAAGLKVDRIDGRVPGPKRESIKDHFQEGDLEVLVCGIRAASEGLTLTASHTVVVAEYDWNWPRHLQCEDRIHRIGQTFASTVYYLVAVGTIEERIVRIIESKREVANAALGESYRTIDEEGILDSILDEFTVERSVP